MRYGARAEVILQDGRRVEERFAQFAFSTYVRSAAATRLTLDHRDIEIASTAGANPRRGLLTLHDTPRELRMTAHLPAGDPFDEVLSMVERGELGETSIEFRALDDEVGDGRRVVRKATLPAVSLVQDGAYGAAGAVEVRARGAGVAGMVAYNVDRVTADRGEVRKERLAPGVFEYVMQDPGREVLLHLGDDAGQVLASRRAGTLLLTDTDEGLRFEVEALPDTTYARDFRELLRAGTIAPGVLPFFRVPPADVVPDAEVLEPEAGNPDVQVRVIRSAVLTALSVRYRAPSGNPGVVEQRAAPAPRPRRRLWL